MKSELFDKILRKLSSSREFIYKKYGTFLFFLALSAILWLFNAMSKTYVTELDYPVNYVNYPKEKLLLGKLPDKLKISIEATGYTLLRYKMKHSLLPLSFDLNKLQISRIPGKRKTKFFILTKHAKDIIEDHLSSELKVVNILPDSLVFNLTSVLNKKVPVVPNIEVSAAKQHMITGQIKTTPDSILIKGPEIFIDTIKSIHTEHVNFTDIDHTYKRNVSLIEMENITFLTKRVQVEVPVEKYTEKKLQIPITIINTPDSAEIVIFPDKLTVKCNIPMSKYKSVTAGRFEAIANYASVKNTKLRKMRVRLIRFPEFVSNINYHPHKVEFFIKRK